MTIVAFRVGGTDISKRWRSSTNAIERDDAGLIEKALRRPVISIRYAARSPMLESFIMRLAAS